jgi:flagellar motility protein MotE (MotC chaperone)
MTLMNSRLALRFLLAGAMLAASSTAEIGHAQDRPADARPASAAKTSEAPKDAKANQYCANIADAAADARFAWQKQTLAGLEKEIEERIKVLERKRAEYEEWLRRRNEFLAKADESIVAIYSRMRPDAAALQLANMNDETAAAILAKLNPRNASAVLNEMEPARAAQLTNLLTDKPNRTQDNEKSG